MLGEDMVTANPGTESRHLQANGHAHAYMHTSTEQLPIHTMTTSPQGLHQVPINLVCLVSHVRTVRALLTRRFKAE